VSRARVLFAEIAALTVTSSVGLFTAGTTWADPAAPPDPIGSLIAPGLAAVQQLSPAIQQAALNPQNASALLTTAAAALSGNPAAPPDSRQVASSVNQFVQEPAAPNPNPLIPSATINLPGAIPGVGVPMPNSVSLPGDLNQLLPPGIPLPGTSSPGTANPSAHIPAAGAVPGGEAHLPAGIDPAHAVGPAPDAAPAAVASAAVPAPDAAPAPAASATPPSATPPSATPPSATPPSATPPWATSPAASPLAASPPAASAPEADAAAAPARGGDAQSAPLPGPAPAFGPDTPPTQEFMYPSIGPSCLSDGGNSLATALAVAGPAPIPKPGPGNGQTAYVFTAVGTRAPAPEQKLPLNVTWVNLTTGKSGTAPLRPNPEINPNGPTTLVATVDTGSGSIVSTIFGQVTTVDKQCSFMPTIGSTVVP
jgi:hypothetical protein